MPFQPGQSGNPGGRPKGSKSKLTKARGMLEDASDRIIAKLVELAEQGEPHALRLAVERLVPVIKPQAAPVALEGYEFANSPEAKAKLVADAVIRGELNAEAGDSMVRALLNQTTIRRAGEERDALNRLLEAAGEEPLDIKPDTDTEAA